MELDRYDDFKEMMVRDINPLTAYFDNEYVRKIVRESKFAGKRSENIRGNFFQKKAKGNKFFTSLGFIINSSDKSKIKKRHRDTPERYLIL